MKRPWRVFGRIQSGITGKWMRWRVQGTFTTEAKAIAGMEKFKAGWAKNGLACEAYVGALRGPAPEPVASDARRE